jgi:Ca2+-binding RTX toxin-like protein
MHPIPLAVVVAIAVAVAAPSVASGATIHQDGRTPHRLLFQDATGETNIVSVEGEQSVLIHDLNMPIEIDGVPTCMPLDAKTVSCAAVRRLELDLGAGPDHALIDTAQDVEIEGGAGRDRFVALATDAPSRVDFDGGIGLDTANYFFATTGVDVTVGGEGGDGRPGDDDHIRRNVESVIGSSFADVLVGDDLTTRLSGEDGDDLITGGTGSEELLGGPGNDSIDARDGASDTIDCGGQLFDRARVDFDADTAIAGCARVEA